MSNVKLELLTPQDSALILIDYQGQMLFAVQSHDRQLVVNNVTALAKTAKIFNVPTILTTVGAKGFSGPLFPEIQSVFPDHEQIDRTTMNAWEDKRVVKAVKKAGRKKLIIAGLWTEICVVFPVLYALRDGYEVYFVTDASGGSSVEAHDRAVQRMIQAGAVPETWISVAAEWQRDWARNETAGSFREVLKQHFGAFGQGLVYAEAMVGGREGTSQQEGKPA